MACRGRGLVQQTAYLDKTPVKRVEGGAGAFHHDQSYGDRYRVFLHADKGFAEAQGADLSAVVREALAGLEKAKARAKAPVVVEAAPEIDGNDPQLL